MCRVQYRREEACRKTSKICRKIPFKSSAVDEEAVSGQVKNHQKGASRTIPRATESWEQLTLPTAREKKHMGCWIEYLEHYFLNSREKLEKAAQVLRNKAKMQALKR